MLPGPAIWPSSSVRTTARSRQKRRAHAPKAQIFEQRERRGTAHAVLAARKAIGDGADDVLVIFADTPLVRAEALAKLRGALADGNAVAVLGFNPVDPRRLWPARDARATNWSRSAKIATPRPKSGRSGSAMAV